MDTWMLLSVFVLVSLVIWRSRKGGFLRPQEVAVFISGCDSGIGKKLAEYFSEMGCLVFAGCLDPDSATSLPDSVRTVQLNLLDERSVREAVEQVENALQQEGRELWALVNNAGVCVYGLFEWQTARQRDWQVEVNLKGTMRLTRECIPLLRRSRGRIITISSVNGEIAYPGLTVYSSTKFALEGFHDALRMELGPRHGIRVITIQPADHARVTSIMDRHRSHVQEMWDDMSSENKEREKVDFERYHEAALNNYGLTSPDSWEGTPLLQDLKEAVLGNNPSSKYLSAPFAQRLVYGFMGLCPQWVMDFVLIKIGSRIEGSVDGIKLRLEY